MEHAEKLIKLYPNIPALGSPFNTGNETFVLSSVYKQAAALLGDVVIQALRRNFNQVGANADLKSYGYLFEPQPGSGSRRVYHAFEVPFVRGNLTTSTATSPALSKIMIEFGSSSQRASIPTMVLVFRACPHWDQYTTTHQVLMQLNGANLTMIPDDYRKDQIAIINDRALVFHHESDAAQQSRKGQPTRSSEPNKDADRNSTSLSSPPSNSSSVLSQGDMSVSDTDFNTDDESAQSTRKKRVKMRTKNPYVHDTTTPPKIRTPASNSPFTPSGMQSPTTDSNVNMQNLFGVPQPFVVHPHPHVQVHPYMSMPPVLGYPFVSSQVAAQIPHDIPHPHTQPELQPTPSPNVNLDSNPYLKCRNPFAQTPMRDVDVDREAREKWWILSREKDS